MWYDYYPRVQIVAITLGFGPWTLTWALGRNEKNQGARTSSKHKKGSRRYFKNPNEYPGGCAPSKDNPEMRWGKTKRFIKFGSWVRMWLWRLLGWLDFDTTPFFVGECSHLLKDIAPGASFATTRA